VTIPNPEHFFEQAEQLVSSSASRRPRQVDLRRAISNAYYAVFHATVRAVADHIVGRSARAAPHYALVYRSVDHRALRELCKEIQKSTLAAKYRQYAPDGFGPEIGAFAHAVVELQIRREAADYDPLADFKRSDAHIAISLGRGALQRFERARDSERDSFLNLLLFRPR